MTARAMPTGAPRSARRSALSARCGKPAPLSWLWRPRKPAACAAPQRAEEPHGARWGRQGSRDRIRLDPGTRAAATVPGDPASAHGRADRRTGPARRYRHSGADLLACSGDPARRGEDMRADPSTSRDNLTLFEADLAACRPVVAEGGHVVRALCPFHSSDRQRSLRVQVHSGRFVCFACGAWGYLAEARERWQAEQQRQAAFRRPPAHQQRVPRRRQLSPPLVSPSAPRPLAPRERASARPDLAQHLTAFQAALPGSRGDTYLQQRGIPLALAQQLGVGYAAPGTWPHAARDWRGGRVVFPHTTPDGCLVNLYGRAVGRLSRSRRPSATTICLALKATSTVWR